MEDPNKAALEKIRLAIPRYRPGSASSSSDSAITTTTGTITTTTNTNNVTKETFKTAFSTNNNSSAKTIGSMHSVGTGDDDDEDDEFSAERKMLAQALGGSRSSKQPAPTTTSSTSTNTNNSVPKNMLVSSPQPSSSSSSQSRSVFVSAAAERAATFSPTPPSAAGASTSSSSSSSTTLINSMVGRLQTLETAQKSLRQELILRDREVLSLRRQLEESLAEGKSLRDALLVSSTSAQQQQQHHQQQNRTSPSASSSSSAAATAAANIADRESEYRATIANLKNENASLRQRQSEMEQFLLDYGLVWVGASTSTPSTKGEQNNTAEDRNSSSRGATSVLSSVSSSPSGGPSFTPIDFPVLVFKLKQLNAIAGEGKASVVAKNGAHQLVQKEKVKLTIFADGFMLYRGPYRHWGEDDSQVFLQDVLEGYFPLEFKDTHPDGVVFEILDKSGFLHDGSTPWPPPPSLSSSSSIPTTGMSGGTSANSSASSSSGSASAAAGVVADPNFIAFGGAGRKLVSSPTTSKSNGSNHQSRPSSASAAADNRVHALTNIGNSDFDLGVLNIHNTDHQEQKDQSSSGTTTKSVTTTAQPLSREAFLAALPTHSVTSTGNIVDVRGGVASVLGSGSGATASSKLPIKSTISSAAAAVSASASSGSVTTSSGTVLLETQVLADMRLRAQEAALASVSSSSSSSNTTSGNAVHSEITTTSTATTTSSALPYEVCTLQVKATSPFTNNGNTSNNSSGSGTTSSSSGAPMTLIIKLRYDDTIADVRKAIDNHFYGGGGGGGGSYSTASSNSSSTQQTGTYELRSAVPPRAYTDTTATLRACGLVPNATLMLRRL